MEGALFRSLLDIDCLNSLAVAESITPPDEDGDNYLEDFHTPALSLSDSIELIKRTGLDSHLLSLLGLEDTDPQHSIDEGGLFSDVDQRTAALIHPEGDSDKGTVLEVGTEKEAGARLKPEEDVEEEALVPPSEVSYSTVFDLCLTHSSEFDLLFLNHYGIPKVKNLQTHKIRRRKLQENLYD